LRGCGRDGGGCRRERFCKSDIYSNAARGAVSNGAVRRVRMG